MLKKLSRPLTVIGFVLFCTVLTYMGIMRSLTIPFRKYSAKADTSKGQITVTLEIKKAIRFNRSLPNQSSQALQFDQYGFNNNPVLLVWIMLILIMVTLASGSCVLFLIEIVKLKNQYRIPQRDILVASLVSILVIAFTLLSLASNPGVYFTPQIEHDFGTLFNKPMILNAIPVGTLVFMIPAISTMLLIGLLAQKPFNAMGSSLAQVARSYLSLKKLLLYALQVLAVVIGFSVITTDTLGKAIKKQMHIDPAHFDLFPKEYSYVYGLMFSLFLALLYIPVSLQLSGRLEMLVELNEENGAPLKAELIKAMTKENSVLDNVKVVLTVFSPLLSSLLPDTFKIFG